MNHNAKWKISLSDGSTLYEDKNPYQTIVGELSPYNRLLKHIEENGLEITSVSIYTNDGRTFNLPSAGRRPHFKEFQSEKKPKFNFFRKAGLELTDGKEDLFSVIEAIYDTYSIQLWVDDVNPDCCWALVKE